MKIYEAPEVYEKIVSENDEGTEQVRLTVNEFRGTEYLHLRKYYLDFEGDFKPSKDGVALRLDFENSKSLFEGLVEILSLAEAKGILESHFKDILDKIGEPYIRSKEKNYQKNSGLGLGIFIGGTLLERNYARVTCRNSLTRNGAEVIIKWKNKDLKGF